MHHETSIPPWSITFLACLYQAALNSRINTVYNIHFYHTEYQMNYHSVAIYGTVMVPSDTSMHLSVHSRYQKYEFKNGGGM